MSSPPLASSSSTRTRFRHRLGAACMPTRRRLGLIALLASVLALAACDGDAMPATTLHATPTTTVHPPVVYVALGASDAVGVGADNPNTQGYVPILISRLPRYSQFFNLGVSGITLHDALGYELPQAVKYHPTLITVWLVGNDFRDCAPLAQYGADLDTLLKTLHDQTQARVFVANAPDFSLLPYYQQGAGGGGACVAGQPPSVVHGLVLQWNDVIDAAVAKYGDVLVNLYSSDLAAHPEYVSPQDGFHPSSKGYAELAYIFWAQITAQHAVPGA